jgi:hypothetical protein
MKAKPMKAWAIVDHKGRIARDCGSPLLFDTSAHAKDWIALTGDRVARVEIREVRP